MIKTFRVYLRIAKNGNVKASRKPSFESLKKGAGGYSPKEYYPTLQIALDLKIDEHEFDAARILLEHEVHNAKLAIGIKEVDKNEK